MIPRNHKVLVCRAPYGGNGGLSSEHPSICNWLLQNVPKMLRDERIEDVRHVEIADTPIPMVRNRFVKTAREWGCDLLLMIDSDQYPDYELDFNKDKTARPFWETSFDFLYKHWDKGPCVIGAPYCGPSPHQNVYVFKWETHRNDEPNCGFKLEQYSRDESAQLSGIQPCAALPTGLILFDIRCFDYLEHPYFYYEYEKDGNKCRECGCRPSGPQTKKASTEDVTATRDISMIISQRLCYNPVYCNWDAWAGHVKQEVVGKPRPVTADQVAQKLANAVRAGVDTREKLVDIAPGEFSNCESTGIAFDPADDENPKSSPGDRRILASLAKSVANENGQALIAEVGSFLGQTAKLFVRSVPDAHVVCVDTWFAANGDPASMEVMRDDLFANFKQNCRVELESNRIEALRGLSTSVASMISRTHFAGKFDLVYIDADHEYESVKADILAWLPLVRDGGVICGHDFGSVCSTNLGEFSFPGVRRAVEEAFGDDFERPPPGSSIWAHVVKRTLPVTDAPVSSNGHAKPKTKHNRKRKVALGR